MKKIIVLLFLTMCYSTFFAQDKLTEELKSLAENNRYGQIVKDYTQHTNDYPAKALYYIGLAYYMTEDDDNALKYIDRSIEKDASDAAPYYIKGCILNYMKKYAEAVTNFEKAIKLDAINPKVYSALGDSFYSQQQYANALDAYRKATAQEEPDSRAYYMIAQIYSETGDKQNALKAFYKAKENISPETSLYANVLYNIGLMEFLNENMDKAELAFIDLIQASPEDYQAYAKLTQVYYHQREYEKAQPYKDAIYKAHEAGKLKGTNLQDMFCFDQFLWNNKFVQAFERYESGKKDDIYNKHLFYLTNDKGDIECRIQTEYSPISDSLGSSKYLLGMNKNGVHSTFNIGFDDDFAYDNLKNTVVNILEGKIQPATSLVPSQK